MNSDRPKGSLAQLLLPRAGDLGPLHYKAAGPLKTDYGDELECPCLSDGHWLLLDPPGQLVEAALKMAAKRGKMDIDEVRGAAAWRLGREAAKGRYPDTVWVLRLWGGTLHSRPPFHRVVPKTQHVVRLEPGRKLGGERNGFSMYALQPGEATLWQQYDRDALRVTPLHTSVPMQNRQVYTCIDPKYLAAFEKMGLGFWMLAEDVPVRLLDAPQCRGGVVVLTRKTGEVAGLCMPMRDFAGLCMPMRD